MRKGLFYISLLSVFIYSSSAWSFLLPPFKMDAMVTAQEIYSYIKTSSQTAAKAVQDNAFIQTTISYGKGAKEALEYKKTLEQYKKMDLGAMGQLVDDVTKADAERSKIAEESAEEIATKTQEANVKIDEINKNIVELEQKIIDDPNNAKSYRKQIKEYTKEKKEIEKKNKNETSSIRNKAENSIKKISGTIDKLKGKMSSMVSSIKIIPSNYDSSKDLTKTAESIMPPDDTDINIPIKIAYKKAYMIMHYGDLRNAIYRSAVLRSNIKKDNEEAKNTFKGAANVESLNASVSMASTVKAQNIRGLLDFIEILIRRMQVSITHNLSTMDFKKANNAQAVSDFNFDNYKYQMPEGGGYEIKEADKAKVRTEINPSITDASVGLVSASLAADAEAKVEAGARTEAAVKAAEEKAKADEAGATADAGSTGETGGNE